MALAGRALLALWNDIAAEHEQEYDRWHTLEHVPERVAVPGMHGARRYVAPTRRLHRYFTLYEAAGLEVFECTDYRDLVDHPTPWSARMRPHFRNAVRMPAQVADSRGIGLGSHLVVLGHTGAAASELIEAALRLDGVVGCHCATGHPAPLAFAGLAPDVTPVRAFDQLTLLETTAAASADAARALLGPRLGLRVGDFACATYALAFAYPGHDAGDVTRHRRPGWSAPGPAA